MQDIPWNFSEEDMEKLYPELKPEDRVEAAYNLTEYVKIVARIFDRLVEEEGLEKVKLRLDYEKRFQNKPAS